MRVATISSPETEAQLRAAQAQVLRAKQALAEAVALIAQRQSAAYSGLREAVMANPTGESESMFGSILTAA
jgi:hypothetical protein